MGPPAVAQGVRLSYTGMRGSVDAVEECLFHFSEKNIWVCWTWIKPLKLTTQPLERLAVSTIKVHQGF